VDQFQRLAFAAAIILRSQADHVALLESEVAENQRLVQSKDRIVAAVNHELRTPLTGIVGFTELLRDENLDRSERREAEDPIRSQAADLSNIVEDLLTAARADMGNLVIQRIRLDLREQTEQTIVHLRIPGLEQVHLTGGPVYTYADAPRVRQIIRNLLINAVRYGGSSVELTTLAIDGQAILRVTDDGVGVPVEKASTIFDP